MTSTEFDRYFEILSSRLSEYRLRHSIGVMNEAVALAKRYGEDENAAQIAGLLHDATKEWSREEHFRIFERHGVIPDENLRTNKNLWHALSASLDLYDTFGIADPSIASAIRFHTTGKAAMTRAETILYVADLTEENRDYPDMDFYRALARDDIEKAALLAARWCIEDLEKRKLPVHGDTIAAHADLSARYPDVTLESERLRLGFSPR